MIKQDHCAPFQAMATGTTGAYASQTGVANQTLYVTDIATCSDKTGAVVSVLDGTTVIWQNITATGVPYTESFMTPLRATKGNSVTVSITGNGAANANVAGFISNNT